MPDPLLIVDLAQNAKAALAGVVAWVVATDVLRLDQPFLAPWAAVLVVHATIYRTVSRGGQQVGATFAGVLLAWGCGRLFGVGAAGMAAMLVIAFLLGRHWWLREESPTIATTGIVVLATNAAFQADLLVSRMLDTTVGVAVGLLVNLLVWPPLRDRAAWARADELPADLADVLGEMAAGLGPDLEPEDTKPWVRQLRRVDERIDEAWSLLTQARESGRMNPRRSQPAGLDDLRRSLHLLEQAVADALSMARTLSTSAENATLWDEAFRSTWKRLLQETAEAVRAQDREGLRDIRAQLAREADELSTDSLAGSAWYEYGGLLVNLRNVVNALAEVVDLGRSPGQAARRSKRYPVREKIPGVRRDAGGRSGLRGLRPGRRGEGHPDRDDHTPS
jgi:uncharacterized membrane protein YgaE (UPF0421/DUF939 family)